MSLRGGISGLWVPHLNCCFCDMTTDKQYEDGWIEFSIYSISGFKLISFFSQAVRFLYFHVLSHCY